jgi:membrane protease YdiL (CAAX protease family)
MLSASLTQKKQNTGKVLASFVVLFALYHAAEYFILFENNIPGFFACQGLFFVAAWMLGNWCAGNGLAGWGLPFSRKIGLYFVVGALLGISLYATPYFVSLLFGIERVVKVPGMQDVVKTGLPFAFGVLFSSFSEDVLTRGLPYSALAGRVSPFLLTILSAGIYLLNHIYRLGDGADTWLYLYLLGVVFIIPVLFTGQLWITGFMHWAGNTFFFFSHNVILTETNEAMLSSNYLFSISLAVFVFVFWLIFKKFTHYLES